MADTAISYTSLDLDKNIDSHRAQRPFYMSGTFVGDDTDNHALKVLGNGKGRFTYGVDNLTNQIATVTLYGMHSVTAEVADAGVFAIDSTGFTVAATSEGYETCNDVFPAYLIRVTFGSTPNSANVVVYVSFSAY